MAVVQLTNLTKTFMSADSETTVLNGLDLTVEQGESVAVVGRSGTGKSTLLSIISGLETSTSGTVMTAGTDLGKLKPSGLPAFRFQHVGIVFQHFHLIPTLTALENVLLPCVPWKVSYDPRRRATELLDMVGLGQRKDRFPAQMSGGEQQRVSIVRALINQPTLVLADEPTGNLDDLSSAQVAQLFSDLVIRFDSTLVMVTHDVDLARTCDRVVTLRNGRLSSAGGSQGA